MTLPVVRQLNLKEVTLGEKKGTANLHKAYDELGPENT